MALTTVPLSSFAHLVLPHAPDCPRPVVESCLRQAVIDFCRITRAWKETIIQSVSGGNGDGIDLDCPEYCAVLDVGRVWHGSALLERVGEGDVAYADLTSSATDGSPRAFTTPRAGCIAIYPYGDGDLRVETFLRPRHGQDFGGTAGDPLADAYNVAPEFVFIEHAQVIADGALSRVLAVPGEPFSNPQAAAIFGQAFARAAAEEKGRATQRMSGNALRTKPVHF